MVDGVCSRTTWEHLQSVGPVCLHGRVSIKCDLVIYSKSARDIVFEDVEYWQWSMASALGSSLGNIWKRLFFPKCNRQHRKPPNGPGVSVGRALGNTWERLNVNQLKATFNGKKTTSKTSFPRNFPPGIAESRLGLVRVSPASGQVNPSSGFGKDTKKKKSHISSQRINV